MKNLTLEKVNEKLVKLGETYAEKYPKFSELELKYMEKYDKHLLTANGQFGNQALRESATRELMREEPEYEPYHIALIEIKILEIQMRNLLQISKNLIQGDWQDARGGEYGK